MALYIGSTEKLLKKFHNNHTFSDIQALTNSADPDQTAPRGAV